MVAVAAVGRKPRVRCAVMGRCGAVLCASWTASQPVHSSVLDGAVELEQHTVLQQEQPRR